MRIILPKLNDERTIRRFAWLPVTIGDERRWLEWIMLRQKLRVPHWLCDTSPLAAEYARWENLRFVDREPSTAGHCDACLCDACCRERGGGDR